jgi:hypothetical protein
MPNSSYRIIHYNLIFTDDREALDRVIGSSTVAFSRNQVDSVAPRCCGG